MAESATLLERLTAWLRDQDPPRFCLVSQAGVVVVVVDGRAVFLDCREATPAKEQLRRRAEREGVLWRRVQSLQEAGEVLASLEVQRDATAEVSEDIEERLRRFLSVLSVNGGCVSRAARAARVSRQTVYRRAEQDPHFFGRLFARLRPPSRRFYFPPADDRL